MVRTEYELRSPAQDLFWEASGGRTIGLTEATEAETLAVETLALPWFYQWVPDNGEDDPGEGPGTRVEAVWSDLAGIDRFANLVRLEVRRHAVTDFTPLSALAKLETLVLTRGPIEDLSGLVAVLAGLPRLTTLILSDSGIRDASPLLDLPHLTRIGRVGNPLDEASREVGVPALQARGVVVLL